MLNGGPVFKFNEAVSFQVSCETQGAGRRASMTSSAGQPISFVPVGERYFLVDEGRDILCLKPNTGYGFAEPAFGAIEVIAPETDVIPVPQRDPASRLRMLTCFFELWVRQHFGLPTGVLWDWKPFSGACISTSACGPWVGRKNRLPSRFLKTRAGYVCWRPPRRGGTV